MSMDPLRDIQQAIADALIAEPGLSGIPIITERRGDILTAIKTALGKLGLCIVIETLRGKPEHIAAGAYTLDLSLGITITENVLVNQASSGTRKPASEVLALVLCILNPLRPMPIPAWVESFSLVDDSGGLLIYQINCKSSAGFNLQE